MKANWSCTACGMYSGRRYCVQRHIDNIHKGKANAIPFVEYLVGRRGGSYPPDAKPSFGSRKERNLIEEAEDKLVNLFVHRAAESFLPAVGDPAYRPLIKAVLDTIKDRQSLFLLKELLDLVKFFHNKSMGNVPAVRGTPSRGATQDVLPHNDVDLKTYDKMLEDFFKQSKAKLS